MHLSHYVRRSIRRSNAPMHAQEGAYGEIGCGLAVGVTPARQIRETSPPQAAAKLSEQAPCEGVQLSV